MMQEMKMVPWIGLLMSLALTCIPASGYSIPPVRVRTVSAATKALFATESSDSSGHKGDAQGDLSLEAFQKAKGDALSDEVVEFDGYDFRDIIVAKWGKCFDIDFTRVENLGFKGVYLNIFPFHPGRKPFRHETEHDYLCHLQAVVEILIEYDQLHYVLQQIGETKKRPIPGRSPLIAVPCRLDLTEEQVNSILGGRKT